MPDHSARPFRMTRLGWHAYDFLIKYRIFDAEELIRKVVADAREFDLAIDWLLPATCSYYYGWARKEILRD